MHVHERSIKLLLPFGLLSLILVLSGFSKLATLADTTDNFYKFLLFTPLRIIDLKLLYVIIAGVSLVEITLGILVFTSKNIKTILYIILSLLFTFIVINLYQYSEGVDSCSCMGSLIEISPELTIAKTIFLIVVTLSCIVIDNKLE